MGNKNKSLNITNWEPKPSQILVEGDGELFICHFDKILKSPNLKVYNKFMIKRNSYVKQLDLITTYTNYFMNYYDQDNELVLAYLKIKYAIDKERRFTEDNYLAFIDFVYEVIFTPTMIKKINQLVFDNYLDDIESSNNDKKYVKNNKKHLESLEFTNMHIKILLRISFGIKIICPILFHYLALNLIKLEKNSDVIFKFYERLFKIFETSETYEYRNINNELIYDDISENTIKQILNDKTNNITINYNYEYPRYYDEQGNYYVISTCDMYNKLYIYVKAKVMESNSNNALIFEQREIFGIDISTVIERFTKKVLISDNIIKYKFGESIIGFNKTVIKFQLNFFIKDQYAKNLTEVTNTKNSDGLSGVDKMYMNLSKIDEGITIMADINISNTINRIIRNKNIVITDEELEYYRKYHFPSKIQQQLVYSIYAKDFGSYRDLNLLTRKDYNILILILKKELLKNLGYEEDESGAISPAALPYIITGNMSNKINTRIIRNNKFISKVEDSYLFNKLKEKKYNLLESIKNNYILSLLSSFINTRFTYVAYEYPDLLNQEIKYSEDKISDELLVFLNNI